GEEPAGVVHLHLKIVIVDFGAHAELFDRDALLLLAGFPLPFALLVLPLAVVHDAAYGRGRVGRDLDKVEVVTLGGFEGLLGSEDADLVSLRVDDAHPSAANLLVDAGTALDRRARRVKSSAN